MITIVPADSAYIVERLGRFSCVLNAGMHFLVPVIDRVAFRFSLLPKSESLSDACITHDNATMRIESTIQWQVVDPERAAYSTADPREFVTGIVRTAQRELIAARPWSEVRETTRELQQSVLRATAEAVERNGLKLLALTVNKLERT